MIAPDQLTGPMAALLAGLVTSLHCAGMCGPLACTACSKTCGRIAPCAAAGYHLGRVVSYAAAGALAGFLGERVAGALSGGAGRAMTWVFALFFLAVAVGLDKRLRLPAPGAGFTRLLGGGASPVGKATVLGLLTPLLPCAPLYLVVAAAALSGSSAAGAVIMAAFALGTIPLLLGVQAGLSMAGGSPRVAEVVRRSLAAVSVVLLGIRAASPGGCPMCP